jgi:predicted O-methyltransferase YrrM
MSEIESRFTLPREFCPNPEFWHSKDSESTEDEVTELVAAFVRALQPNFVLETGTAFGYTSMAIGKALATNGHGRLVTLEKNADMWYAAKAWLDDYELVVGHLPIEMLHMNSMEYEVPENTWIDFAFFDSWQEGRAEEFLRYRPYMKSGIIVAFHDTAPHHQVWKYVSELEEVGHIKTINLHTPRGIAFAQVL